MIDSSRFRLDFHLYIINLDILIINKKAVICQYYTGVSSRTFPLEEIVLIGSYIGEFHLKELAESRIHENKD
jgi:hypothetical protein